MNSVLFDLDGTITDSAPGILVSVRYAVKCYEEAKGLPTKQYSNDELNFFIGPPLIDSFVRLLGCSHEDSERCLVWYREYYTGKVAGERPGMLENSVYSGIPEMLETLRKNGIKSILATAKPEVFARQILDHFQLTRHFDYIHGATLDDGRNRKAQVVEWALAHSGEIDKVVMVGDRSDDVKGAAANGVETIGVLWGYGDETELTAAGARVLVRNTNELTKLLTERMTCKL